MITHKYLKFLVCITLLFFFISVPFAAYSKDTIRIGTSRSVSGPLSFFETTAYGPNYHMWVKEVNARGGIYVKEYNKKLPIELIVYDDKSDMGTMTRLLEKLIVQDKVDFVLAPTSTAHLFAATSITEKYKYILIGAEGGLSTIMDKMKNMPYLFGTLSYSDWNEIPALIPIYKKAGVKTIAIIYIDDLHGVEYYATSKKLFPKAGIEIKMAKGVPADIKDISAILKEAKRLDVDALLCYTYPPLSMEIPKQSMELGINFKSLLIGPGSTYEVFKNIFGQNTVEGIMGWGTHNIKLPVPGGKQYVDLFLKYNNNKMDNFDWWGGILYYAGLQMLEQAIEKAGTLNMQKVRDVMISQKLDTYLGKTWYTQQGKNGGGLLALECYPGQVLQWQKGVLEVLDLDKKGSAPAIYPKPEWPKQGAKK
jgi:branched-chain amino acid transport system substrate-binding protein